MAAPSPSLPLLPVKAEPFEVPLESPPTPMKGPSMRAKPEPVEVTLPAVPQSPNPLNDATSPPVQASISGRSPERGSETAQRSAVSKHSETTNAACQDEVSLQAEGGNLCPAKEMNAPVNERSQRLGRTAPLSEAREQLLKVTEKMRSLEGTGEQTGEVMAELRQLAAQSVSILSQLLQVQPASQGEALEGRRDLPEQNGRGSQQEGNAGTDSCRINLDCSLAPQEGAGLPSQSNPAVKEEDSSNGSAPILASKETALEASRNERLPSPEAANVEAAPRLPETPAKVCVKAEWSDERAISPPSVRLGSPSEVQSQIGAEPLEQEEDVGSGLEDNDDGFESEPELEAPQEEQPAYEVPPVAQLFCGESDEDAESEEERPKKVRKVTKKAGKNKATAVKKPPLGGVNRGSPSKAKGAREGGRLDRKATEPAGLETKRLLQSLERQFKRSFTRAMLPSHVGGGYWLGIPKKVGDQFMEQGKYDVEFVANGRSDTVVWLYRPPANKELQAGEAPEKPDSRGFSGGWIHCAIAHELVVGDIVLFEKLSVQKFRLHIFRKRDFGGNATKAAAAANRLAEQLDGVAATGKKAGAAKGGKGSAVAGKKQGGVAEKLKKGAERKGTLQKRKGKAPAEEETKREEEKGPLRVEQNESENVGHHLAQTRLTDIYPVVKEAKGSFSKGLAGEADLVPAGVTAGRANDTAGDSAGTGGSSGEKRVKCTPKRKEPLGKGKKRSLSELVDAPLPKKAKAETAVISHSESGEPQFEKGRPVHHVDGGHRYVEASEGDQRKAKQAMERFEATYPSFRVVASKSHVNKGFWLSMSTFCRENKVAPKGLAALVDGRGRMWHTRIKKEGSLSGGWRGFSIDHKLEVGDGLVFEMVLPSVFRVRIFRASKGGEEDDCRGAGKAYEGVGIGGNDKERHRLTAEQKKVLTEILGLPGGLRKPSHSSKSNPPAALFPRQLSPSVPARAISLEKKEERSQAKLTHVDATLGGPSSSRKVPLKGGSDSVAGGSKKQKKASKESIGKKRTKGTSVEKLKGRKLKNEPVPWSPKQPPKAKKEFLQYEENPQNWDHSVNRPRHCEDKTGRIYTEPSLEQQEAAAAGANRAAESIPEGTPYCVLDMKTSHVDRRFWRGLPHTFLDTLRQHADVRDEMVHLRDVRGFLWEAMLLERKSGLSGGWRGFACDHELEFGDNVILELLKPDGGKQSDAPRLTFGVRIFRAKWDGKEDDCKRFAFEGGRGTVVGTTTAAESKTVLQAAGLGEKKQKRETKKGPPRDASDDFDTGAWVDGLLRDEVSTTRKAASFSSNGNAADAPSFAGSTAQKMVAVKEEKVVKGELGTLAGPRSAKRAFPAVSADATAGTLDERPSKREFLPGEMATPVRSVDRMAVKVERSTSPPSKMLVPKRAAPKSNAKLMTERLKRAV